MSRGRENVLAGTFENSWIQSGVWVGACELDELS
jgi:hypothetical protein